MAVETNYINNPNQYDGVSGRSVSYNSNTIPSGVTTVKGYFFHWNPDDTPGGFINTGWYSDFKDSPVNTYNSGKYANDDAGFQKYVESLGTNPNLNDVFTQWEQYINNLDATSEGQGAYVLSAFVTHIQENGGFQCVTLLE